MASINEVTIDLKFTGLNNLEQATKKMRQVQTEVKRLAKEEKAGALSADQYSKRVSQLATELQKATKGNIAARNAVNTYSRTVRDSIAATDAAKKAAEELTAVRQRNATILALQEQRLREEARAQAESTAKRQREIQSYNQLRAVIDQSYAARMRLKQAADTLRAAERQGLITREQAIEQLRQYRTAAQQAAQGGGFMGRNVSKAGVLTQQAGYQVGDFIVQIQSGTNAFVAFGQQATQIAGTLTLLGGKFVAIGTVLGIAIPLVTAIAAGFMRTRQEANETADSLSDLDSSLKSLDSTLKDWLRSKKAASMGITVEELLGIQGIEQAEQNLKEAQDRLKSLTGTFSGGILLGFDIFGLVAESRRDAVRQAEAEVKEAEKILNQIRSKELEERLAEAAEKEQEYIRESAEMFIAAQQRIREENGKTMQERIDAENRIRAIMGEFIAERRQKEAEAAREQLEYIERIKAGMVEIRAETTTVSGTSITLARSFAATADEAVQIAKALDDGTLSAQQLSGVNINAGVLLAAKSAQELAKNLGISLRTAMAMAGMVSGIQGRGLEETGGFADPRSPAYDPNRARIESVRATMESGVLSSFRDIPSVGGTSGGGAGAAQTQEDYLQKLQEEAELKLRMIGLSEEDQRYQEIVNELKERELPIEEERIQQIINTEEALRQATDAETRRQDLMQTVNSSIEQSLMSLIDGSKSVEDAMTGMIRAILQEIAMQAIVRPIASGITGALFGGFADGGAFRSGNVIPFANGGVVGGPTAFPMSGGRMGLMGEAGPEAIMPLKRGKGGKLGVVAEGASQPVVIHQNFNFSANGDDSVKRIIAQEAPKIANLTQKQVLEARSRGGAFRTTFGA